MQWIYELDTFAIEVNCFLGFLINHYVFYEVFKSEVTTRKNYHSNIGKRILLTVLSPFGVIALAATLIIGFLLRILKSSIKPILKEIKIYKELKNEQDKESD